MNFTTKDPLSCSSGWNNLFFLWAVFRERRIDCSDALPGPQRPCKSSLQEELLVQDSPSLLASDFSTSKNINLHEFPSTGSSKFEMLPKAGIIEHNTQVNIPPILSSAINDNIRLTWLLPFGQMSSEAVVEPQCEISPCPDLGNQITTLPLCLEQNSGVASPVSFYFFLLLLFNWGVLLLSKSLTCKIFDYSIHLNCFLNALSLHFCLL